MSSMLVGYHVMLPTELKDEEKIKLHAHLDKISQCVNSDELLNTPCKDITLLNEEAPLLLEYIESELIHDPLTRESTLYDVLEDVNNTIKLVKEFIDENMPLDYPDVSHMYIRRSKADNFHVYFAGDTSHGDTPDGAGFKILEMADRLGLLDKLTDLVKL
jgi:hypothetical protein